MYLSYTFKTSTTVTLVYENLPRYYLIDSTSMRKYVFHCSLTSVGEIKEANKYMKIKCLLRIICHNIS